MSLLALAQLCRTLAFGMAKWFLDVFGLSLAYLCSELVPFMLLFSLFLLLVMGVMLRRLVALKTMRFVRDLD